MFASERILLLRCLPGNSMAGISSVLWLTISPRSVLIKPFHVPGLLKKSPNHFLIVPRPGFRAPTDHLTTFSNPFSGVSRTLLNHRENMKNSVPVLSAQKPWFSQGFSHIGPIALAFLPIHACPCLQVLRRLVRCLGPRKRFSESS